jgi:small subunit ribosomal protein S9
MAKAKEKVSKKEKEKKIKKRSVAKPRTKLRFGAGEKPAKKPAEVKAEKKPTAKEKPERYLEAVGRRKTSIARIRLFTKRGARVIREAETPDLGEKDFSVNGKPYNVYFPTLELQQTAKSAFEKMNCLDKFRIQILVKGGGLHSQAEAVRHGSARVLVLFNPDFRKRLKKVGFLTRDPRMRERKKFGLKRARRAPQWAKR